MRKTSPAAVLFLALGATAASAQIMGLYYQETEKDGRVYVFNTPEAYAYFTTAGEMAKSITLLGRAEGGKTLIAENETAADLYLFKHNLPGYERPSTEYKLPFDVSWKDGKTTIKSKTAELKISNRVQVRFTAEDLDATSATSGPERESFRIRRAKTKFEGWVYSKDLSYELQLNWADSANVLEDAQITYDLTHGKQAFTVKAGQFKVPFGRQELTSSGSQQFVDRSAVSNAFARGRDVGLQVGGAANGGTLDWRVGLFNGNGRTVSLNDNGDLQLDARVQWAPFGDPKYSEGDFDSSDRPLFAIAAGYEDNTREIAAAGTNAAHQNEQTIVAFDSTFKFKGLSIFGEYFDRENDRSLATLSDFDDEGYTFQVGYFVVPKTFEIALRLSELDPNQDVANNERSEDGVAFSYYWNKHNHKLQADYRQLEDAARGSKDKELRIQYQIIF